MSITDAVYVLGSGSVLDNIEIKFSLRSLEGNAIGLGRIFIVGEKPDFLQWSDRLVHVPFQEKHGAYRNVWEKLRYACAETAITDRFVFMNDDFYIVKKFEAGAIPQYARGGDLKRMKSGGKQLQDIQMADIAAGYDRVMKNTLNALLNRGLPTHRFCTHQPVNFDKQRVLETYAEFKTELALPYGLSFRSCYGNFFALAPVVRPTFIVRNSWNIPSGRMAFASHRDVDGNMLTRKLAEMFPRRSSFEINL